MIDRSTTRRNVVRAGAWSLPVVAAAAAAPTAVASAGCTYSTKLTAETNRYPHDTVCEFLLIVTLGAGSCTGAADYTDRLALSFTLDNSVYSGYWSFMDGDPNNWTWNGQKSGRWETFDYTLTGFYPEALGGWMALDLSVALRFDDRFPPPVTFNLSGPGGVSASVEAAP